jgi:ATP-dependent DNA helicase RecQ
MNIDALLQQHFGFDEFRPGQREVIESLLDSGRALAIFPTGGGKSLCYQLPALALDGVTLVVSPLIALMKDQIDFLQRRGIAAARLDSSLDAEQTRAVNDQVRAGTLKLLYVAPERFNNERFLNTLQRANVAMMAVDEAHCISEWGHNFRPDYLKLAQIARDLKIPRLLALTATATPPVAQSICAGFDIPADCAANTGFYRPNLKLCLTPIVAARRHELLLKRLQSRPPGSGIVYVMLQRTAEEVAEFLAEAGIDARAYHAGMDSEIRHEVQEWWMQGDNRMVVATIAFGMGIDKADVRYVYHFNLPKGLENYAQEIGRAGRDGKPSVVELFASGEDVPALENFVYGDTPTRESLHALIQTILESGDEFSLAEYEWSTRFDLRSLVLRTALTYLELDGVLKQGTPFYAGYEVRPFDSVDAMLAPFGDKAAQFLRDLLATAKKGRIWLKIDPDVAMEKLGCRRENIVRAMELLEERNVAQVRAADLRQRYTLLQPDADVDELVESLFARFERREGSELRRIQDVLDLVEHDGCQTNALVAYFGEMRPEPCGHCSFCLTGRVATLPPTAPAPALDDLVDRDVLNELREEHPDAFSTPRQVARFLCGLSSPAVSKARLGKHPLFGKLETQRFASVLEWCEILPQI